MPGSRFSKCHVDMDGVASVCDFNDVLVVLSPPRGTCSARCICRAGMISGDAFPIEVQYSHTVAEPMITVVCIVTNDESE